MLELHKQQPFSFRDVAKRVHDSLRVDNGREILALQSIYRMVRAKDPMHPLVVEALHKELGFAGLGEPLAIWTDAETMAAALERRPKLAPPMAGPLLSVLQEWPPRRGRSAELYYVKPQRLRVGASDTVPRLSQGWHHFQITHRGLGSPRLILLELDMNQKRFWSLIGCRFALIDGRQIDPHTKLSPSGEASLNLEMSDEAGEFELFALISQDEFPDELYEAVWPDADRPETKPVDETQVAEIVACLAKSGKSAICVARCRYRV
jgi:hypothetical protein